jgi:RNA polymerase sigma-70 factor (ECF subfamily)
MEGIVTAAAPTPSDDVALLAGVARGDPDAVDRLLDDVAPAVYGFVLARVGSGSGAADDLVQEILLEGLRSQATFRGESTLTTWLCAIARRRIARYYEAERRSELARSGLAEVSRLVDDTEQEAIDRRDEILAALGRLPALHRQVLVLKYLDGYPVAQIATTVGRTPVQVQSLLQRARQGLRRHLGADDG